MSSTPHCTRFCGRRRKDGREWHVHANAKRSRRRKHACQAEDCCRPSRRLERKRLKVQLREEGR